MGRIRTGNLRAKRKLPPYPRKHPGSRWAFDRYRNIRRGRLRVLVRLTEEYGGYDAEFG